MMSKIHVLLIATLFITVGFYVEGTKSRPDTETIVTPISDWLVQDNEQKQVTLTVWSPVNIFENDIKAFEAIHPNVNIEVVNFEGKARVTEQFLNALADGSAPDLMVFTHRMLGSFNSIDKLADLSKSPLQLNQYRSELGEYLWTIHQSLDGNRIFALPYEAYPLVLYYRSDLIKEAGFPDGPEQLAAFLEEPDNWNKLASALKQKQVWTAQWVNDQLDTLHRGQFIFNRALDYNRTSDTYKRAFTVSMQSRDLTANVTIWSPNGLEIIKQGKLAMIPLASWGEDILANWVPEQAGKWKVTRLPFGGTGIDLDSSKSIAITMQSKHKAVAAQFLQYILEDSGTLNWFKRDLPNPFLGHQDSTKLYQRLVLKQPTDTVPTPLDDKAFDTWKSSMDMALFSNIPLEAAMEGAEVDIMDVLSVSQQQLQEYMMPKQK